MGASGGQERVVGGSYKTSETWPDSGHLLKEGPKALLMQHMGE